MDENSQSLDYYIRGSRARIGTRGKFVGVIPNGPLWVDPLWDVWLFSEVGFQSGREKTRGGRPTRKYKNYCGVWKGNRDGRVNLDTHYLD